MSGEVIGTAEMRMHSTARGVLYDTESVYRVTEELEKGRFVQKITQQELWKISPYAEKEEDILNWI